MDLSFGDDACTLGIDFPYINMSFFCQRKRIYVLFEAAKVLLVPAVSSGTLTISQLNALLDRVRVLTQHESVQWRIQGGV